MEALEYIFPDYKSFPEVIFEHKELKSLIFEVHHGKFRRFAITEIPKRIIELEKLEVLKLTLGSLQEFPMFLSQCNKLKELGLIGNPIETLPDDLSAFEKLETLAIGSCELEVFPNGVYTIPELTNLDISYNYFEELPDDLFKLRKLKRLSIHSNYPDYHPQGKQTNILNETPESLIDKLLKIPNLEELEIDFLSFKYIPESIYQFKNLKKLSIQNFEDPVNLEEFLDACPDHWEVGT